jgi:segregation and condensation protein B
MRVGSAGGALAVDSDSEPDKMRRLEAVLFLAREPLNSRKLAELARLDDGTQARTLIRRLNDRYDCSQRPYLVQQIAEGFQMLTRPKFASWLRRLRPPSEIAPPLTGPALETLTVIAYRQPILKAEIEAIRGVNCSDILRQLMERDMVRISGRSTELGRPFLYSTTKNFLRTFGLSGLDALPRADQLRGMGLPSWANTSQNLDTLSPDPSRFVDTSEESHVRLTSSSKSLEELETELGTLLAVAPNASALDIRAGDADEDEFEDEEDDEEDDWDDDEEDEDEEEELEEEEEDEWEEIEDDEEWDEDDDEEDEDWDDDEEDEEDDWE